MNRPGDSLSELLEHTPEERKNGGYFHTASEIQRQPELWIETRDIVLELLPRLLAFCGGKSRIVLTGAGSSFFVALSAAPSLRKKFPLVEALSTTDIVMDPESCFPRDEFLLVSFARSGDSPESLAVVDLAEQLRPGRVKHLAITCNGTGALARRVGELGDRGLPLVLPGRSNDKGLAMTSSFSCMTVAGYALAFLDASNAYAKMVKGLARVCEGFMGRSSDLARGISTQGYKRMFFIASRPSVGGVMEAHLKVQELSAGRILTKADDTLGLRHGFLAAVDHESLFVLFLSGDPYRRLYEMDLLNEIRSKGIAGKILVVSERLRLEGPVEERDLHLEYDNDPSVTDDFRSLIIVLVGQLIGLHCSLQLGLKPDNPSPSGVISRVVKGVTIHPYGTSGRGA